MPEILTETKRRYQNRPIVAFELAVHEQMKIADRRLSKLFSANQTAASFSSSSTTKTPHANMETKEGELHIQCHTRPPPHQSSSTNRTRPPIKRHILDVARGSPAQGVEVRLDKWDKSGSRPTFGLETTDSGSWNLLGFSATDRDGPSGRLMDIVDDLNPGVYRISFDMGKYNPQGFFPYVSIVFEVRGSRRNRSIFMSRCCFLRFPSPPIVFEV